MLADLTVWSITTTAQPVCAEEALTVQCCSICARCLHLLAIWTQEMDKAVITASVADAFTSLSIL